MIEVRDLVKWYGPTLAVDGLNLAVPKGQIVGFLGPNGAGKTTTLRILTGYIPPTSGTALIDGHHVLTDSQAARRKIGYMPEHTPLYGEMRVEQYLDFRGRLHEMDRLTRRRRMEAVIDRCGLREVRRRLIGQLSRGNCQRLGLAQAMLHEPPVLILDEPTAGLDPNQIGEIRRLFNELRGQHTIILSTHILPEVEKTADRIVIIARGRIVADGPTAELRDSVGAGSRVIVEVKADAQAVRAAFGQLDAVTQVEISSDGPWCRAMVSAKPQQDVRAALGQVAADRGWPVREMRREHAGLEPFFVRITAEQDQATDAA